MNATIQTLSSKADDVWSKAKAIASTPEVKNTASLIGQASLFVVGVGVAAGIAGKISELTFNALS